MNLQKIWRNEMYEQKIRNDKWDDETKEILCAEFPLPSAGSKTVGGFVIGCDVLSRSFSFPILLSFMSSVSSLRFSLNEDSDTLEFVFVASPLPKLMPLFCLSESDDSDEFGFGKGSLFFPSSFVFDGYWGWIKLGSDWPFKISPFGKWCPLLLLPMLLSLFSSWTGPLPPLCWMPKLGEPCGTSPG